MDRLRGGRPGPDAAALRFGGCPVERHVDAFTGMAYDEECETLHVNFDRQEVRLACAAAKRPSTFGRLSGWENSLKGTMIQWTSSVLVALVLLLTGVHEVMAQTIRSPYRFIEESQTGGIWAGYLATERGSVGLGPEAGPIVGGRYSIRLSGAFTVEADAGYFWSTRAVLDTAVVDGNFRQVGEADFRALLLNGALRFNLTGPRTWNRLQPYVIFGAGAMVDLTGTSTTEELLPVDVRYDFGTSFAGLFGGGVEWFPSERVTFRLDLRDALWKINTPTAFLLSRLADETTSDEWTQNFLFSVGAALHF